MTTNNKKIPKEKLYNFIIEHRGIGTRSDRKIFQVFLKDKYNVKIKLTSLKKILKNYLAEISNDYFQIQRLKKTIEENGLWHNTENLIKLRGSKQLLLKRLRVFVNLLNDKYNLKTNLKEVQNLLAYESFKQNILSFNPQTKTDYIDAFLELFWDEYNKNTSVGYYRERLLLKWLLFEQGYSTIDLNKDIETRWKQIKDDIKKLELEMFEKELLGQTIKPKKPKKENTYKISCPQCNSKIEVGESVKKIKCPECGFEIEFT